LAERHRVIAVELQCHGRTADIDRPMAFEHLAVDVVGLLDHLGIEMADVFGFSNGGPTTYELLVHHPGRLPTEAHFAAMRDAYVGVAPDPAHFEAFAQKVGAMVHGFRGWADDQGRAIEVPVLVMIGDTDFILVPNAAEAAELMSHGQLAVLPGTTHMDMTRNDLIAPVVEAFLQR